jgi:hypothetical protein
MTNATEIARLERLVRDSHLDRIEYDQNDKHYTVTRNAAGGLDVVADTQLCEWFALCDHPATSLRAHPILGDVPICDRCTDKLAKIASS